MNTEEKMILNERLIKVDVEVEDWRNCAREAGNLLVKEGLVKPEYIDLMIETVEEFGPYMILVPKVCFFHGRPGEYVHQPCLSLITLKNEVRFTEFDNQPIRCAFAFGATDSDSHLGLVQNIAKILSDEEFIELITTNGKKEKILEKIERMESNEAH